MIDWVFVDTCIWASFFSKPNSLEQRVVSGLSTHAASWAFQPIDKTKPD